MTIINIPLTLASTAPTSMIPEVSAHYARRDIRTANQKIDRATWISMIISIPAAVGLAVLAGPVVQLLFPGTNGEGSLLLILGAITIILNGNSNISNGVLQGIGKPKIPMIHAAIALVADVHGHAVSLYFTDLGIYTIVIAMIVYAVVMCLLNEAAMRKYMRHVNPWRTAYLNPLLASVPMALVAGGVYYGLNFLLPEGRIFLTVGSMLAIGLGGIVYLFAYLFISRPDEEVAGGSSGGNVTLARIRRKISDKNMFQFQKIFFLFQTSGIAGKAAIGNQELYGREREQKFCYAPQHRPQPERTCGASPFCKASLQAISP